MQERPLWPSIPEKDLSMNGLLLITLLAALSGAAFAKAPGRHSYAEVLVACTDDKPDPTLPISVSMADGRGGECRLHPPEGYIFAVEGITVFLQNKEGKSHAGVLAHLPSCRQTDSADVFYGEWVPVQLDTQWTCD
jgi:hypothetical protein